METKYTPGPWQVWPLFKENRFCVSTDPLPGTGLVREVCTVPEEDVANARLIAAAPELLAALQLFTEFRAALGKTGAKVSIADVEKAARAAIEKATGR